MSSVPPPKPRRRRWPWILLVAGLGVLFVRSDLLARALARAAERVLEPLLGEEVDIARLRVELWPLGLDAEGVVVTHPSTGDTVVSLPHARATVGLDTRGFRLRRVEIDRPRVELHLDPDGLREFRALAGRGGAQTVTDELPWDELVLRGGSFALWGQRWSVEAEGIGVEPAIVAGRSDLSVVALRLRAGSLDQTATGLVFPGVGFGPDWLDVPNLAVTFPGMDLEGRLGARLGGPLDGDLGATLRLARLTAPGSTPPPSWVDGVVEVDARLSGSLDHPAAGGTLAVTGLTFWTPGARGPSSARIGDLTGGWHAELTGPAPAVVLDDGEVRWGEGRIAVQARVGLQDPTLEVRVRGHDVSLAEILRSIGAAPTPWVDLVGAPIVDATGTWSPFRLEGPVTIGVRDLRVGDGPLDRPHETLLYVPHGEVVGRVEVTPDHLVIAGDHVRAGRSRGRALADIGFGDQGPLRVEADFERLDLSWLQPLGDLGLGGMARVRGRLSGPFDHMTAEATLHGDDVMVLGMGIADHLDAEVQSDLHRLWFTDVRATLGGTRWRGSYAIDFDRDLAMDLQLAVEQGRLADLVGAFVDLPGIDGAVTGSLALTGTPYDLDGDAEFELGPTELYGETFAGGYARGWMDDGELTLEELVLERGTETLRARGSVKKGWRMNVEVRSDRLRLENLDAMARAEVPLSGDAVVDVVLGGTLFDWEPRGRIALRNTAYGREALADSTVRFRTEDATLDFEGEVLGGAARLLGTLGLDGDQPYRVHADLVDLPLHPLYPRAVDGSPIGASASGTVDVAGRFGVEDAPMDLDVVLGAVELAWQGHRLRNDGAWELHVDGETVAVPTLRIAGGGGTRLALSARTEPGVGLLIDGSGRVDLDLLRAVTPGLAVARGQAEVRVRRTAEDPTLRVRAEVDGATVRTDYFPETFTALDFAVDASADGYTLQNLRARVGGGTLESPLSAIVAEGWVPRRYALQAALRDARVAYFDYLPPLVGDADLAFDGPVDDLLLSGDIVIRAMDFRDRIDWEGMVLSLREERLTAAAPEVGERWFGMDLHVTADRTIHLANNVAEGTASADLRVIGDTARPGMVGEVRVTPGGQMYLHEREFDIARGEIRFVDPYTFDPDLDILLETEVRSREQEYQVGYAVTGPFSDWRTTTTSEPQLAQADINALLLFGYTREELERYGGLSTALVAETGDLLLGQTALARGGLFVDRWSLVSGVSERGSTTASSELRLVATKAVGDFDVTVETTVSQGVGRDWYASVERRLAERLYATVYMATQQEGRSLPIGAAWGTEVTFRWEWE